MRRSLSRIAALLALLAAAAPALAGEPPPPLPFDPAEGAGQFDPRTHPSFFEHSAHQQLGCLACHVPRQPTPAEWEEAQRFLVHFPLDPTAAVACMNCHRKEAYLYRRGIHYRGVVRGILVAPHCVDCHAPPRPVPEDGSLLKEVRLGRGNPHAIADTRKSNPAVPLERIDQMCSRCHANEKLAERYGWSKEVVPTYEDSVHGRRAYLGSKQVPTCSSCHRAHGIVNPAEPASPVHPNNVQETCSRCHPGASRAFSLGFRHARLSALNSPGLYWLEKGYVFLIVLVVGFLYSHVLFDLITAIRLKLTGRLRRHSHAPLPPGTPAEVRRLSLNLRLQHIFMFTSTTLLVLSGWPMKIYEAPLSRTLEDLFGGVDNARLVHRGAALVLVATFVWHAGYVLLRILRRKARFDILPGPRDLVHVVQQFLYYFGIRKQRPRYGKFTYSQKMEYLAVVWGTIVMGLSGAVLWSSQFVQHLPAWVHKAANIVHGYEALLAAIAVFGVHFYMEHLRYQVFPMSRIWITGKASSFEYREEWPADFERRFGTVESSPAEEGAPDAEEE